MVAVVVAAVVGQSLRRCKASSRVRPMVPSCPAWTIIRGWGFSEAARVGIEQVALYLDGRTEAVIPCCSTRADVAQGQARLPERQYGPERLGHYL